MRREVIRHFYTVSDTGSSPVSGTKISTVGLGPGMARNPKKRFDSVHGQSGFDSRTVGQVHAWLAQLVEQNVANVQVAGSNPVPRTKLLPLSSNWLGRLKR